MGLRSLACVRECSALLGLVLAIGAGDDNLFPCACACDCSLGRFLLYDRSAANTSVEGRQSLLRSAIPDRESANSGVEGWRLFSPRRGMDSRARNSWNKRKPKQSRALTHARKGTQAHSPPFPSPSLPKVFAKGKSYEHGFVKKCNGHKLSAKSQ
ncbi:hypothetical protein BHM03_00047973 [Ensete ventricosum]|nr:hypothetical protein BHM03_00047973 [Ensete ventricosum]